jgi:hypothetical protein
MEPEDSLSRSQNMTPTPVMSQIIIIIIIQGKR